MTLTTFSEHATNPGSVMRLVFGVAIVVSIMAGRAHAQSSDVSGIAEQLFDQARELAKANRWAEACPKFEASLRYDPVLGTRLNLATCYEHIGKIASAWSLYRESINFAKKAGDVKRRNYAQQQAAALEPRLPKLAISAPAMPPAGFVVKRDGTPIDAGALGVALYVDPGTHEITASAPGFEAFTQTVTLTDGKAKTVAIPNLTAIPGPKPDLPSPPVDNHVVATEPVAAPSSPAHENVGITEPVPTTLPKPPVKNHVVTTEPMVEPSSPARKNIGIAEPVLTTSATRKYIALGIGATGVAAVGVGFLFGAKASATFNDLKALCGASLVCDPADYDKGTQLMRDARSTATLSTVLVAAGGAAIVASAIVFLTRPHPQERATARIVPMTHARGAGLAIMGRF
jgi:hypothetical protein